MEDSPSNETSLVKFVAPVIGAVVLALAGVGYAVHEHHAAEQAAAQSQQASAELAQTRSQLDSLTAKVSELTTRAQEQQAAAQTPAPAPAAAETNAAPGRPAAGKPRASRVAGRAADRRLTKMQAQLDAQGKAIEDTRGDLASAKTELTGSIAKTHDELVVLEKRGERNYFEFDLQKTKAFAHEGPLGVSLRKANVKHQYADLELMVEDRDLTQKHVNLNQPVMFYQSDSEQPIQVVVNDITKDHIHGYVSAPKYRKSELASMADGTNGANAQNAANAQQSDSDGIVGDTPTTPRKKLTVPQ